MIPAMAAIPSLNFSGSSRSGDAASGSFAPAFQYNGQFVVGGSGKTSATTEAADNTSSATGGGATKAPASPFGAIGGISPVVLAAGFGVLAIFGLLLLRAKKS